VSPPETQKCRPPLFRPDFLYAVDKATIRFLAETKNARKKEKVKINPHNGNTKYSPDDIYGRVLFHRHLFRHCGRTLRVTLLHAQFGLDDIKYRDVYEGYHAEKDNDGDAPYQFFLGPWLRGDEGYTLQNMRFDDSLYDIYCNQAGRCKNDPRATQFSRGEEDTQRANGVEPAQAIWRGDGSDVSRELIWLK